MPTRRRFLAALGLPAAVAAAGGAFAMSRPSGNPYYSGPVTDHFDGTRFFAPGRERLPDKGRADLLKWQLSGGRTAWPASLPSPFRDRPPARHAGLRVALVGHASVLVQIAGTNLLVDPVWSERASPFSFVGPQRINAPGIAFEDLPPIDAVLVTHNHYDHMDAATLSRLARAHRCRFIVPLGNDAILAKADPAIRAEARDWGDAVEIAGRVRITLEPALHWSARWLGDRRMALWASFVIEGGGRRVYHVGDTGYAPDSIFPQARLRHGGFDLAILPIGAYEPRWFMREQHMNPVEALAVMRETGARAAVGHHWGTFRLTNEGAEQPALDLAAAREAAGLPEAAFRALRPGEVWADQTG
jgi:L-ascorbate metabolism protein UlaG (beta-lactamase superfamily)